MAGTVVERHAGGVTGGARYADQASHSTRSAYVSVSDAHRRPAPYIYRTHEGKTWLRCRACRRMPCEAVSVAANSIPSLRILADAFTGASAAGRRQSQPRSCPRRGCGNVRAQVVDALRSPRHRSICVEVRRFDLRDLAHAVTAAGVTFDHCPAIAVTQTSPSSVPAKVSMLRGETPSGVMTPRWRSAPAGAARRRSRELRPAPREVGADRLPRSLRRRSSCTAVGAVVERVRSAAK